VVVRVCECGRRAWRGVAWHGVGAMRLLGARDPLAVAVPAEVVRLCATLRAGGRRVYHGAAENDRELQYELSCLIQAAMPAVTSGTPLTANGPVITRNTSITAGPTPPNRVTRLQTR
jgi:hypothetical protein